jgi:hypothetical protein
MAMLPCWMFPRKKSPEFTANSEIVGEFRILVGEIMLNHSNPNLENLNFFEISQFF